MGVKVKQDTYRAVTAHKDLYASIDKDIDILKENQELSYEALQEILISRGKTAVVYESSPPKTIEENITRQTKTQISKLSELLLKGGAEYVN